MHFRVVASFLASVGLGSALVDPSEFDPSQIITRDVCVIGGGSAGTYAAIRLRLMNQSVAVVEKSGRLGGHTETYRDPETNTPVDYGVLVFDNLTVVTDYFGHFDIPLTIVEPGSGGDGQSRRIDFRSGEPVDDPSGNVTEAMARYAEQLLKYPFLNVGFDLPDPVPEDLLLPFGDFAEKYDLGPAVDIIALFAQGVGDILRLSTIYVMKYFSLELLQGAQNGFLSTANHNNGALYVAAHEELAGDVFFNSTVAAMDRDGDPNWVHVVVESPDGRQLIRTRQLISAIPPKLDNLRGFDLDDTERFLFGQFNNTYYYTVLAQIDNLPPGTAILNRAVNVPYGLPPMPAIYILNPTPVPGLFDIFYGSEGFMSEEEVKEDMTQAVQRLQIGDLNAGAPEFVLYKVHQPFELIVPPDAIANGFYRELQGLQGRRRTLYTGAAFETHDSSRIWRFTEALLQSMLQGQ